MTHSYRRWLATGVMMARTLAGVAGGPGMLIVKTIRLLRAGGWRAVWQRVCNERRMAEFKLRAAAPVGFRTDLFGCPRKLLFVDWSVPQRDKDSASLTSFHLIEIFVRLGYDVSFISSDSSYPEPYITELRALGVRCLCGKDFATVGDHLSVEGADYGFVVLNRARIAALHFNDVKTFAPNAKIIFNTVDLHYLREQREAKLHGSKKAFKKAQITKELELEVIKRSDATIVLSPHERQLLAAELPQCDVRDIPLVFSPLDLLPPGFEDREGIVFIGSFPHKPNVDAVLYFAKNIFPELRARLPHLTWEIVGHSPPREVMALSDLPGVTVHGFVSDLDPLFRNVRLSVAPLRYGAGLKGKIATSLAYGVPVVASSLAVEGMGAIDGEHVIVADDPHFCADAIVTVYESRQQWEMLSKNGQQFVIDNFSVPANTPRVRELMKSIDRFP